MSYYDRVAEAAGFIRERTAAQPDVAVVLGSGLGECASGVRDAVSIPYDQIPHWPAATVVGHEARLAVGTIANRKVATLSGRTHFYEAGDLLAVTFAVRVVGVLGTKVLILTNAAGGIDTTLVPGTIMVIDDHVNLLGVNPLCGPNDDRYGPRFPDMSEVYSGRLRGLADAAARALHLKVAHGVYVALPGPSYETPAEIRYLRAIGADAVGMSTVPDAIVARHMGLEVLGISCITNMAAGVLPQPVRHDEVVGAARHLSGQLGALLEGIIGRL